jgi:putative integral membrane protein (TIGR02587 family)
MTHTTAKTTHQHEPDQSTEHFAQGLARAFAGALIFSISLFMTMEMWWLGFTIDRVRLAIFTAVTVVLLIGLSFYRGFEENLSGYSAVVDAFVGYAVGVVSAAIFLPLFGTITPAMPLDEIVGKIALLATAGSIGALLARSQLGSAGDDQATEENKAGQGDGSKGEESKEAGNEENRANKAKSAIERTYWGELFIMIVGTLFVGYTVAPTEEIILIAYQTTPSHAILMVLVSLIIIHSFVYRINFRGQEEAPEHLGFWALFRRYSVAGYLMVFLTTLYILWTFGRTDNTDMAMILRMTIVLALPGALGAAAARLIL